MADASKILIQRAETALNESTPNYVKAVALYESAADLLANSEDVKATNLILQIHRRLAQIHAKITSDKVFIATKLLS